MQSLLELLRGQLQRPDFDDTEFAALLDLAEQENILSYAAHHLRLLEIKYTPDQQKRLQEICREAQLSSFVWTETLKSLLSAFDRAALPVMALKGPCLAERLFGEAELRSCYDLDLLVRNTDIAAAEQVLTDLGFSSKYQPDDYHHAWSRRGINVELHHNVENPVAFNFDLDAAWGRANRSVFHDVPVWLLAPADELLYLCLHGVRHRFDRLCLVLDLVRAFRILPAAAAEAPEELNRDFANVLALGSMMAAKLDPQTPEPAFLRLADYPRMENVANQLWQERMLEPAETLDWAAQHRFYLELEPPGLSRILRRWRHTQILLTRLIEADFAFARRFHMNRHWQVRLLRPIRLLVKSFHTPSRTV